MPAAIEFKNVSFSFDEHVVLDNLSFSMPTGGTTLLLGESGAGKTIVLKLSLGLLRPDTGEIFLNGQRIDNLSESELLRMRTGAGIAFQENALFDSLTVAENVLFSLELREDYDAQNKEDVVDGLLDMVDILQARDVYPSDLSTGYKRAVAIARALAAQPQCVLYDEPTTMVDPIMSDHLSDLMLRLKKQLKLTSVVVTHDLDLMYKVADRVVILYEGTVIFFGPVADLEKSDHPHIREFLEMDRVVKV